MILINEQAWDDITGHLSELYGEEVALKVGETINRFAEIQGDE